MYQNPPQKTIDIRTGRRFCIINVLPSNAYMQWTWWIMVCSVSILQFLYTIYTLHSWPMQKQDAHATSHQFTSLLPRPLPDFISQPWRKTDFSLQLRDKIWEWPGNEAISLLPYSGSNFRENPLYPPEEIFAFSASYWPRPFIVAGLTEDERCPVGKGRMSSAGLK